MNQTAAEDELLHLRQLLELSEQDRRLAAFELHDGLAQQVAGALMHLEAASHAPDQQQATAELDEALKLLREAAQEARRIIGALRPAILDERGLIPAIEQLIADTKSTVIEFASSTPFDRLAEPLETAIYRITQEALTNVRRHSGSKKARVELTRTGDRVRLEIRDWGAGFDPESVPEGHFGLRGIRQRAEVLGGQATIETAPGAGTVVRAEFPAVAPPSN